MRLRLILLALAAAAAAVLLAPTAGADHSELDRQLQRVKAATARFNSVQAALKAGYLPPGGTLNPPPATCVVGPPGSGAMGYHFENPTLMEDNVINLRKPEVLVYERKRNGQFRLVAVEYYIEADQVAAAPTLFGQTFKGPMDPHHPGQESHYDLHAWIWKGNPLGTFSDFNPRVHCP